MQSFRDFEAGPDPFGRTWQVKVQADASDRKNVGDIFRVRVRTARGDLVPLRAVADVELITAPSSIVRYNNLRSVSINGGPAPDYSSGEAIAAMQAVAAATLPHGFSYEWTGTALQEKAASGQTGSILGLAVVFAYLFLVGLYERAGRYRLRHCCRSSSVCSGRWRHCCCLASTTTSTPRSASSC